MELWTNEYFIDLIERKIKHEIATYYNVHFDRNPSKIEYEQCFNDWKNCITCNVTNYDLGIYEQV